MTSGRTESRGHLTEPRQWLFGAATFKNLREYPAFAASPDGGRMIGLPQRFFHYFTTDGLLRPLDHGTGIIRFGYSISGDYIAVDSASGRVVLANAKTSSISSVVNSSLANFIDFLQVCESRYPYYADEGDLDDSIQAAEALRNELASIDPAALEPGTYWSDFLSDVAIGDYT